MAARQGDGAELLGRFLELYRSRGWKSQEKVAAMVGVSQKTVWNWKNGVHSDLNQPAVDRLAAFFERLDTYGIEIAELPEAAIGEVNEALERVKGSEVLRQRLTSNEHLQVARDLLARRPGPMANYIERRLAEWQEGQAALEASENSHDRTGRGSKAG